MRRRASMTPRATPWPWGGSEAHGNELVDAFLVDLQKLVDDDGVALGIDGAETFDIVAGLGCLTLGDAIRERDEDLTGLLRVPHEAARQRPRLDETSFECGPLCRARPSHPSRPTCCSLAPASFVGVDGSCPFRGTFASCDVVGFRQPQTFE